MKAGIHFPHQPESLELMLVAVQVGLTEDRAGCERTESDLCTNNRRESGSAKV